MEVLKPGTDVDVMNGIRGKIKAIMIGWNNHVQYLVVWLNGNAVTECWVDEWMIKKLDKDSMKIGFTV